MTARGMALFTGLVLLAAISLIALAGTSAMILQKHMANNFKRDTMALRNAELAQSFARAWLFSRTNIERESGCIEACVLPSAIHAANEVPARPEYESGAWWDLNGIAAGVHPETGEPLASMDNLEEPAPYWIIEELHFEPFNLEADTEVDVGVGYYRVLGRGTGGDARSVAVTEAILARPWGESLQPMPYPPDEDSDEFCQQFVDAPQPRPTCGMRSWRQRR